MTKRKIRAAGSIFLSVATGRVMLTLRSESVSHALKWGFVGGKIGKDENILEGLERELTEEIGFVPHFLKVYPFDHFVSDDKKFEYSSVVILTPNEFIPMPNHEIIGYCWSIPPHWPKPLHPGARAVLTNERLAENLEEVRNLIK